jgi:hypothetical protein
LDFIVNRDLNVNRNLTVNNNLTVEGRIIQPITGWNTYAPSVVAYSTLAGRGVTTPVLSTGMVYTAVGRYNQIGNTVYFYIDVNITTKGTNFVSNPYVTLPPIKPYTQFSCNGVTAPTGNTDDSKWNQLFGYAKASATDMLVGPSSYSSPTVLANLVFPLEFTVNGVYEASLT